MHEMSLCQGLFGLIDKQKELDPFERVLKVVVEIGAFGHVEPAALRFAFDAISPQSIAENAEFEIIEVPARAWCMICSVSVALERRGDACPTCGGYQLIVEQGEELRLKELEVI